MKSNECINGINNNHLCTYGLLTQKEWPADTNVTVEYQGSVIAVGRINDDWLEPQSNNGMWFALAYCEIYICLKTIKPFVNKIIFVDEDDRVPITRADIAIRWFYVNKLVPSEYFPYKTDDEGQIFLTTVPSNAAYIEIEVSQIPCYDYVRKVLLPDIREPIPIKSQCLRKSTPSPIPTSLPFFMPTDIPSSKPTGISPCNILKVESFTLDGGKAMFSTIPNGKSYTYFTVPPNNKTPEVIIRANIIREPSECQSAQDITWIVVDDNEQNNLNSFDNFEMITHPLPEVSKQFFIMAHIKDRKMDKEFIAVIGLKSELSKEHGEQR